jgi:hypothetical protein
MSNSLRQLSIKLMITAGLAVAASPAIFCQALNSSPATVSLSATLNESLTISATPAAVSFNLVSGGTATGSAPVAVTTTWVLKSSRATVTLTGWFTNAAQALSSGGATPVYIPTSEVLGQLNSGTFSAFTGSPATGAPGVAGASLLLYTQAISTTNVSSNRTDNLNLEINLSSQPQLPAATYNGTLNLEAQAL